MKTGIVLLLALLFSLPPTESIKCSCTWGGSFLDVSQDADLVALVRVKRHTSFKKIYDNRKPMSMEVEVMEVLQGREDRKTLIIWGDDGNLCRPFISNYSKGSVWVIAFTAGSSSRGQREERNSDYSISICGEYWLEVDRGRVRGVIEGEKEYVKNQYGKFVRNNQILSWGEFRSRFLRN
ncbi:MAG: hypothetical protein AAFR87_02355 [Bacteroidota bacterium]